MLNADAPNFLLLTYYVPNVAKRTISA